MQWLPIKAQTMGAQHFRTPVRPISHNRSMKYPLAHSLHDLRKQVANQLVLIWADLDPSSNFLFLREQVTRFNCQRHGILNSC